MAAGVKTGGRQKGTPNKISATVRENVVAVFDEIGGVDQMVMWARENTTEFYRLYARLLPTETTVSVVRDARNLTDADLANIATGSSEGVAIPQDGAEVVSSVH